MKKLHTVKRLRPEYAALLAEKTDYAENRKARDEMRELLTDKPKMDRRILGQEEQAADATWQDRRWPFPCALFRAIARKRNSVGMCGQSQSMAVQRGIGYGATIKQIVYVDTDAICRVLQPPVRPQGKALAVSISPVLKCQTPM